MKKAYRPYAKVPDTHQEIFNCLVKTNKKIARKLGEIYTLQIEKRRLSDQLIDYLHRYHFNGIKKNNIIAYLQLFSRGVPSFWQVFNATVVRLCNRDKTLLQKTYITLSRRKGKTEELVVK